MKPFGTVKLIVFLLYSQASDVERSLEFLATAIVEEESKENQQLNVARSTPSNTGFNEDYYVNWSNPYAKVAVVCRFPACGRELNPKQKNSWKPHYESHCDVKNFGCYCCEKRFRLKGDLKKHITTVHKVDFIDAQVIFYDEKVQVPPVDPSTCHDGFVNPYVRSVFLCNICSKELNPRNRNSWKPHHESHANFKKFGCYVCSKPFRLKGDLKKHIKTVHQQEMIEHMVIIHEEGEQQMHA